MENMRLTGRHLTLVLEKFIKRRNSYKINPNYEVAYFDVQNMLKGYCYYDEVDWITIENAIRSKSDSKGNTYGRKNLHRDHYFIVSETQKGYAECISILNMYVRELMNPTEHKQIKDEVEPCECNSSVNKCYYCRIREEAAKFSEEKRKESARNRIHDRLKLYRADVIEELEKRIDRWLEEMITKR